MDALKVYNLLIKPSLLQHLCMETHILLEESQFNLNGTTSINEFAYNDDGDGILRVF